MLKYNHICTRGHKFQKLAVFGKTPKCPECDKRKFYYATAPRYDYSTQAEPMLYSNNDGPLRVVDKFSASADPFVTGNGGDFTGGGASSSWSEYTTPDTPTETPVSSSCSYESSYSSDSSSSYSSDSSCSSDSGSSSSSD